MDALGVECDASTHPLDMAAAIAALFTARYPELVRLAGLLGADDPEDIAQEAFAGLLRNHGSLRDTSAALAYVRATVCNLTRNRGAISVQTIAYRSAAAMTKAVSGDNGILYEQIVPPASWGVAIIKEWTRGLSLREQIYDSSGALTDDHSAVVSHGQRIRRNVDYLRHVWTTDSIPVDQVGSLPPVTQQVVQLFGGDGGSPAATVTSVTVSGRRMLKLTVDGSESLTAAWHLESSRLEVIPAVTPTGPTMPGTPGTTTVWIDATSYLPVRIVATSPTGQVLLTATFAMLPATPANLATLSPAPVPAGFQLVP